MDVFTALIKVHLRSSVHSLRDDIRMRTIGLVSIALYVGGIILSTRWLSTFAANWRILGPGTMERQMWTFLAGFWGGLSLLGLLYIFQTGLVDDETLFLFQIPLKASLRFRLLYFHILIEQCGLWITGMTIVLGFVFGIQALPWLLLLISGAATFVLIEMVGIHLVIGNLLLQIHHRRAAIISASIAGLVILALLIVRSWMPSWHFPSPYFISGIFALIVCLGAGPFARFLGEGYITAFHVMQALPAKKVVITPPGIGALSAWLMRFRGPYGAVALKELLSQSRNPFNWARFIAIGVYIFLFPFIQNAAASAHIPVIAMVCGFISLLTLATMIDATPSPIGSEGNRLSLYLTAPLSPAQILWAKLIAHMPVLLIESFILGLALGLWLRFDLVHLLLILLMSLLLTLGAPPVLIWGSAWDEDLDLTVEGSMQELIHEQFPSTPRRLLLIGAGLGLLGFELWLVWQLAIPLALLALILFNCAACYASFHFGLAQLSRVVKGS